MLGGDWRNNKEITVDQHTLALTSIKVFPCIDNELRGHRNNSQRNN